MIPRFHWLLPLLRAKLLLYSLTTPRPYKENHPVALGRMTVQGIQRTKNTDVLQPSSDPTKLQ